MKSLSTIVECLGPGEGERWRQIRLRALADTPGAFSTKHEDAVAWPSAHWEQQLVDCATFVTVADGVDVGVARGAQHPRRTDARTLISMWVAPTARRHGIASLLIDVVADWATTEGARLLVLGVVADNHSAIACYARAGFELSTDESLADTDACELRMVKRLASTR